MSADDDIRGADVPHLSFALVIAGLDVRYTSHLGWPQRLYPEDVGSYADHKAITYISPMGGRLDVVEGIAEYDPITIQLGTNGRDARTKFDPGLVLGRIGHRDADHYARVITTIDEGLFGPADIEVDRDVSGWGFPRTVHIGAETMHVNGAAGDGTEGNPYRLTGVGRRYRASAPQRHDVGGVTRPWVVSDVVYWSWRRAILYARAVRPDGTFGAEVEVMRGFLREAPSIEGETVTLELLPLTAVLDRRIAGAGQPVGLVSTHHYFEGSAACVLEHYQRLKRGNGFSTSTNDVTAANSQQLNAPTDEYAEVFDIALPIDHPRHGSIARMIGMPGQPPTGINSPDQFALALGQPAAFIPANRIVQNGDTVEAHRCEVIEPRAGVTGLLKWPEDVLARIRDEWSPGDYAGLDGSWADIRVHGQRMTIARNVKSQGPVSILFRGGPSSWPDFGSSPAGIAGTFDLLHYPIDFAAPDDGVFTPPISEFGQPGPRWFRKMDVVRDTRFEIRGVCPGGWYQSGERYILVDTNVLIPSSGVATIEITHYSRGGDEQKSTCRIISSTALATGYAIEVHPQDRDRLPSFGDWQAGKRVEIRPTVRFDAQNHRDVLLSILHSNGGNFATDAAWDREVFGAGLLEDDVDDVSFSIPAAPGLERWSPIVEPGTTLRDIIDPILKATSTALVMRRDGRGRCRMVRIRVGIESTVEVSERIENEDWVSGPYPSTRVDSRITSRYELKANHSDGGAGKAEVTVVFEDLASSSAQGDGSTLKVEMRGLQVNGRDRAGVTALFAPMVAKWAELAGYARKRWDGGVSIGKGWRIGLGSTIQISSRDLRGPGGEWGVVGAYARVLQYRTPLWAGDGDAVWMSMSSTGAKTGGIAPSLRVNGVVDPVTLTVKHKHFAMSEHPITGAPLADLDFFSLGDYIDVLKWCDDDNFVTRRIIGLDRDTDTITLDGPHDLMGAAGPNYGVIEVAIYDLQTTTISPAGYSHRQMVSLADANGKLGAADDEGFTLA